MTQREKVIQKIADAIKKNDRNNEGASSYINYAAQVYKDVFLPERKRIKKETEKKLCSPFYDPLNFPKS